jgi:hypothetical protein
MRRRLFCAEVEAKQHKPVYATKTVTGKTLLSPSSGGNMSANASVASECLLPEHGGVMAPGSANVTDVQSSGAVLYDNHNADGTKSADPIRTSNIGWRVTEDSPQKICVEVWSRTSAQETNVYYKARVIATERYRVK